MKHQLNNTVIGREKIPRYSPLSNVLDHQVAADVKGDFLSNFLYIFSHFKLTNS